MAQAEVQLNSGGLLSPVRVGYSPAAFTGPRAIQAFFRGIERVGGPDRSSGKVGEAGVV